MRCLNRNKSKFWYCLFVSDTTPAYDDYGNEITETVKVYAPAVEMRANISWATGQSSSEQFGDLENYDKVIVTDYMNCPINEHSVLFVDKEPEYDSNGVPLYDYTVRRVAKSLNGISIAIRKVTVG